jgi:hypothetical protein
MTPAIRETEIKPLPERTLDTPGNATRTTDYKISPEVWEAYLGALERADDLEIALEVRTRAVVSNPVELEDFIREQGYDPAEFQA